jgi:ribonuclease Z
MNFTKKNTCEGLTRRDLLKGSGLALGGLAIGGVMSSPVAAKEQAAAGNEQREAGYFYPGEPLDKDEMRITFCGTWYTPREIQACNSVFVEIGGGPNGMPADQYVFDCGSGVTTKYVALAVPYSRMNKIFLTHLHGDHTSDLFHVYCFGPSSDRKTPLNIFGPRGDTTDEGTNAFCDNLYAMGKWHRESFSFLSTGYTPTQGGTGYNLAKGDGFDLFPTELPYMDNPGLAYSDPVNGVTITHFPAIHARNGSISYKLEWNGLSMVFTGDTKPNRYVLEHAKGVDVLIHEMTVPADEWTIKETGLTSGAEYYEALKINAEVIENSHTEQTAFGYVMSKTNPRLGVATHCPVDNDLIQPALKAIGCYYKGPVAIARDLMVINVSKTRIRQRMAVVTNKYPWYPHAPFTGDLATPKYNGPLAQFNNDLLAHIIPRTDYSECSGGK